MNIYKPTKVRKNFFALIAHIAKTNDVITVTGKEGPVVIISQQEYENMMETIQISTQPGMVESILTAAKEPNDKCSDSLEW